MSDKGITVEFRLPGRRKPGKEPVSATLPEAVSRIARLLALAWKWELAVRRGEVKDYATIARRHGLTRARVTQICGLALLSPSLQDQVLAPASAVPERLLRILVSAVVWSAQEAASSDKPTSSLGSHAD